MFYKKGLDSIYSINLNNHITHDQTNQFELDHIKTTKQARIVGRFTSRWMNTSMFATLLVVFLISYHEHN